MPVLTILALRQGEVIPLELAFSPAEPGRYNIDLDRSGHNRSGRVGADRFTVVPEAYDRMSGRGAPTWL